MSNDDKTAKHILCSDCGWRGPETTWRRKCRGSPCRLGSPQPAPPNHDDKTALVERIDAEIKRQRTERGDIMTYGEPDPILIECRAEVASLLTEVEGLRAANQAQGEAIDFAAGHCGPEEAIAFLDDWRLDRADEWPGFVRYRETQRAGARQALEARR